MDLAAIRNFILRQRYGVVSSIASDGTPQSALVGIACTPRLELIFDTLKSSRKYANLLQRPSCSMVIGCGDGEQTLQIEGVAEELEGDELRLLQEVYLTQWPDGHARLDEPDMACFVIRPRWIRYSDYDERPPLIEETWL